MTIEPPRGTDGPGTPLDSQAALAGAIAHDFNNLLTTIMGCAGLVRRSPQLSPEDREHLALIEEAAGRAAGLTARLLHFARGGQALPAARVDLRAVVSDTIRLCAPMLRDGLHVHYQPPGDELCVEGDEPQLLQVVLNIVLNASDALGAEGSITLALEARDGCAVLSISDDGPGMPEAVRAHIFEPFFTTKAAGAGTGLGLPLARRVVEGHGGTIEADSAPGAGATFVISLPLSP